MMNEIFGEENFVAQLIWERAFSPKNDAKFISNSHDYILMYARNISEFNIGRLDRTEEANARYSNPDNDPRGVWQSDNLGVKSYSASGDYPITTPSGRIVEPPSGGCWRLSKETFLDRVKDNRIWFGPNGDSVPRIKRFLSELRNEGMVPTSLLFYKEVGHSQEGAKQVVELFDGKGYFDGPKPVRLIKRLLTVGNAKNNDIILDFFAGSGTTAHAVAELNAEDGGNRKWICIQLGERTGEKSEVFKAGYHTIADIARERIRRADAKIRASQADKLASRDVPLDLGFRAYRVDDSNFKQWNELVSDPEEIRQQALESIDPLEPNATDDDILTEVLLKRGISPLVTIEQRNNYLLIPSESLAISLAANLTETDFARLLDSGAEQIVLLSHAFGDDANLKVNAMLQAEQRNVNVEVV